MTTTPNPSPEKKGYRPSARTIIAALLVTYVVLVAILNQDEVSIDLVFGTLNMKLFFVIVISALFGFIAGWIFSRQRARRKNR
jgi:uncharacterized integral membrane protein